MTDQVVPDLSLCKISTDGEGNNGNSMSLITENDVNITNEFFEAVKGMILSLCFKVSQVNTICNTHKN